MISRLDELQGVKPQELKDREKATVTQKGYDIVKAGIAMIKENMNKVQDLQNLEKVTANPERRADILAQMEVIFSNCTATGQDVKKKLDEIKLQNDLAAEKNPKSVEAQMRFNLHQSHLREFSKVMEAFMKLVEHTRQSVREKAKRDLLSVDPGLSDEQIEHVINSGQVDQVMTKGLAADQIQKYMDRLEQRRHKMKQLEEEIGVIHEMFTDLGVLVDAQQEALDHIEIRVNDAKDATGIAVVKFQEAEAYANAARRRSCCIAILCFLLIAAIATPLVLKFVLH